MVWGWTVLAIVVGSIAALTALGLLGFWLWSRRVEERTDYEVSVFPFFYIPASLLTALLVSLLLVLRSR